MTGNFFTFEKKSDEKKPVLFIVLRADIRTNTP